MRDEPSPLVSLCMYRYICSRDKRKAGKWKSLPLQESKKKREKSLFIPNF
jgi:hypothetical protein